MGKKKDFDPKEPGQQYEEIIEAQQWKGHDAIGRIQKSKDRDQEELDQLADDALKHHRQAESTEESRPPDELEG
jgi:hypothetical protein